MFTQTYTGKKFELSNPEHEMIDIVDIAHALSQLCRFGGHTRGFYSVAQHCYHASCLVPRRLALAALLHDAAEAYVGDVVSPLKHYIDRVYTDLEDRIQTVINDKYDVWLSEADRDVIKLADLQMLRSEAETLLPHSPVDDWVNAMGTPCGGPRVILPLSPKAAERLFLMRFNEIY